MEVTVGGAWYQVELPSAEIITGYDVMAGPNGGPTTGYIVTGIVVGSNNGTTWYYIDKRRQPEFPGDVWYKWQHFSITNTSSYKYYRYIVTEGIGWGWTDGVNFFGFSITNGTNHFPPTMTSNTQYGYTLSWSSNSSFSPLGGGPQEPYNITVNQPGNPINWAGWLSIRTYSPAGPYTGIYTTTYIAPPTIPDAPVSLSAVGGDHIITVSFTAGSNGGYPITNYKYSIDNGSTYTECSPAVTTSPIVITGLTIGQSYSIKILAVNSLGDGTPSNTVTATPHVVPDAPTNLVASYNGSGSVSISFTPGSNGGETISNYQYSINCGVTFTPFEPVDGISPVTISGLTNGQTYCIELKAMNSAGAGIASSSVEYTASGPPTTPVLISATDLYNGRISVTVTVNSQGSPFTNFSYSLDGGTNFTTFDPPQTSVPLTISGLANRVNYNLAIKATNANGTTNSSNILPLYYRCFLEGTKILCYDPVSKEEIERPVESLRSGDLVKTTMDGYKAIDSIGTSKIYNPANSMRSKNRLYKCSKENYPELKEDLIITGCHAVLVSELSDEERSALIDIQGKVYVTEDYYRLIACVDKRAQPYEKEGLFNIWHFALENDNYYYNYGIYANGLKVETASKRSMKEMSGMDLIQ